MYVRVCTCVHMCDITDRRVYRRSLGLEIEIQQHIRCDSVPTRPNSDQMFPMSPKVEPETLVTQTLFSRSYGSTACQNTSSVHLLSLESVIGNSWTSVPSLDGTFPKRSQVVWKFITVVSVIVSHWVTLHCWSRRVRPVGLYGLSVCGTLYI